MVNQLIVSMIEHVRHSKGWSQAEFAHRAGLTPEGLSRAKKGCSGRTLEALARAANMRLVAIPDDDYLEKVVTGSFLKDVE